MSNEKQLVKGFIGELYTNDIWVRSFMDECFIMWGFPHSTISCMSQTDRTMFAWGMLHLVQSLNHDKDIWFGMRDKIEPVKAAWEFSRRVYEKHGLEVIPAMPSNSTLNAAARALTGPMKVDGVDTPVSGSIVK